MLQKEVVDRLAAAPDTEDYGRLSVMVQYYCKVERLFTVPPGAFHPVPKVDSAVVRLTPYTTLPVQVADEQRFAQVVAQAFSQRRKTLRNTLKGMIEPETMAALDIDPGRRAETLSLGEFAALADACR
jgi:16S rRNA (adenine1518-N6/adenine1519-N6)-dimethyltransferase